MSDQPSRILLEDMAVQGMESPGPDVVTAPRAPHVQRVRSARDLEHLELHDGLAALEIEARLLDEIAFAGDVRDPSPRLDAVLRSVRSRGYLPFDPIICRIGMKGRWVVVDGGHRLTAARRVMREILPNIFRRKVVWIYALVFLTEGSWSKCGGPPPGISLHRSS